MEGIPIRKPSSLICHVLSSAQSFRLAAAMTQSVSFRITRTAEDVAQTLNALSQRLVKLEQRLESLELQLRQQQQAGTMAAEEHERLDGVDLILQECQDLLRESEAITEPSSRDQDMALESLAA